MSSSSLVVPARVNLTISGIDHILDRAEVSPAVVSALFSQLLDPNIDGKILQVYCDHIRKRIEESGENPYGPCVLGFDGFGKAMFAGGIVRTMILICENPRPEPPCAMAGYWALDALNCLVARGTVPERHALLQQLLDYDIISVCLNKLGHPLCTHRRLAADTLRVMAAEGFLGDKLPPAQINQVFAAMCRYTLSGPEHCVQEMQSPATSWQSQMFMGQIGIPSSRSARYVHRFYAMSQESALWAIHGFLCHSPPLSRQRCLEILQHDPVILDLLFECSNISRPAWYPESQVDAIACEVLACLLHYPLSIVPGILPQFDQGKLRDEAAAEWESMIGILRILVARPGWVENIISVWTKINDEKWQLIRPLFQRVKKDYLAYEAPDDTAFREIFEYRGVSRICMLRLIATMTHVAKECDVPDTALLSLLRIGYAASGKIVEYDDIRPTDEGSLYIWIERNIDIYRSPMHTVFTGVEVADAPVQVAPEGIMGPVALIRLLTVLAERGILDDAKNWTELPAGTSTSTSLGQIKQITNPDVVRRCLILALKRVTARRDKGRERLAKSETEYACTAYVSAAELAVALVSFDIASRHKFTPHMPGVYNELVLCLGNAAQMSIRMKQYRKALNLASCAIQAAQSVPKGQAVEPGLLAKNNARVQTAKAGL